MRVAHLIYGRCNPESANGVDKAVYHLSRYQAALGAEVAVFSLTRKEPLPIPGVEVRAVPQPRGGGLGTRWPHAPRVLLENLLGWKPDIVHFHSVHIGPFIALGRILRSRGVRYVVTPHGGFAPGRLERIGVEVRTYIRLLEKPYLEGAHFVHAVSRNDAEGLKTLGIHARIAEVPNGIDLATVPQEVDAGLLRRRYPALEGKRVFLFLGRLDPAPKGLDLLLEGFAQAEADDAALVLVGPDRRGSTAWLQSRAEALGLGDRVIFAGPAYGQEKWAYLAGMDVFVHTSRSEGSPFSVLEALAMGKSVLASTAADPEGKIGRQGAGLTVPPTSEDVAEAISYLSGLSPEELMGMGRQARALAEEYDLRRIARRLLEVYNA